MKKTSLWLALFYVPTLYANHWQNEYFNSFSVSTDKQFFEAQAELKKGNYPLQFHLNHQCYQPETTPKLNQTVSLIPCKTSLESIRLFRDGQYLAQIDMRSGTPTLRLTVEKHEIQSPQAKVCPVWDSKPLTVEVSSLFSEGEMVRDFYSGNTAKVINGKVTLMPSAQSQGLLLLEAEKSITKTHQPFNWKNATVYFVLTDRFYNANPDNDHSYGRQKDGMQEIGTFHGGDLLGLTQKLDYLQQLGVNALWMSSPLEQIYGWVGGGSKGDFPHYAYHGYYHQDWTKVDANMGSEQDLQNLIQQAHKRGIRVIFDIVMNHTGYATLADMQAFGFGSLYLKGDEVNQILGEKWTNWKPKTGQNWHTFNDFINFSDKAGWQKWWGKDWVRSDLGDYDSPKYDDLGMSLASLPDLKTEADNSVKLPSFYQRKSDTQAEFIENTKVRDYLITWLTDWVRKYGVDGFRVDTAKHVEKSTWLQLKQSAEKALKTWQRANADKSLGGDFWMTGEAWGHGVAKSDYYQNGFDAMINFDFQDQAKNALHCFAEIVPTYTEMSTKLTDFNVLSYLSSHDTRLFFHSDSQQDIAKQKTAAAFLMLAPGAVQLYYGDESGREFGATGSDPMQGTRSDMNWQEIANHEAKQDLLAHWTKLAQFRQKHPAIGDGEQIVLDSKGYTAFARQRGLDKVMVVWAGNPQ